MSSTEESELNIRLLGTDRLSLFVDAGFDYAATDGKENLSHLIENNMDFMAFNTGILKANAANKTTVKKLQTY